MSQAQTPQQDPGEVYLEAATLAQSTDPAELAEAYRLFASIPNYLDASKRAAVLKPYYDKLELQKKLDTVNSELKARSKARLLRTLLGVFIALVVITFGVLFYFIRQLHSDYKSAVVLYNDGFYESAIEILNNSFFVGKDAIDLKNKMQKALDIYDTASEELLRGSVSPQRMLELQQELSSISYYEYARQLLNSFQLRLSSCTVSGTSGTATVEYDYASKYKADVSVDHTLSLSELSAINDFKLLNLIPDAVSTTDFAYQYPSDGYNNHTIISEFRRYVDSNVIQQHFTYQDGSTLRIHHLWYDYTDDLIVGYASKYFPKPDRNQTVYVYSYKWDENRHITNSWRQELTSTGELSPGKKEETVYTYDDQDRLIRKESASSSTVYTYDEAAGIAEAVLKEGSTETRITYYYGYWIDFDNFAQLN